MLLYRFSITLPRKMLLHVGTHSQLAARTTLFQNVMTELSYHSVACRVIATPKESKLREQNMKKLWPKKMYIHIYIYDV